jgi:hypothetical protein
MGLHHLQKLQRITDIKAKRKSSYSKILYFKNRDNMVRYEKLK